MFPWFVSVKANAYFDQRIENQKHDGIVSVFDVVLHVGAWITAIMVDSLLALNEGKDFAPVANTLLLASLTCTIVAGTVVVLLLMVYYGSGGAMEFLPASFTSLVTAPARASAVFSVLTTSVVCVQIILAEAIADYNPASVVDLHVVRMLIVSVAVKLYGVACTVNNHRLENTDAAKAAA